MLTDITNPTTGEEKKEKKIRDIQQTTSETKKKKKNKNAGEKRRLTVLGAWGVENKIELQVLPQNEEKILDIVWRKKRKRKREAEIKDGAEKVGENKNTYRSVTASAAFPSRIVH